MQRGMYTWAVPMISLHGEGRPWYKWGPGIRQRRASSPISSSPHAGLARYTITHQEMDCISLTRHNTIVTTLDNC